MLLLSGTTTGRSWQLVVNSFYEPAMVSIPRDDLEPLMTGGSQRFTVPTPRFVIFSFEKMEDESVRLLNESLNFILTMVDGNVHHFFRRWNRYDGHARRFKIGLFHWDCDGWLLSSMASRCALVANPAGILLLGAKVFAECDSLWRSGSRANSRSGNPDVQHS